jgi:hypothetical protein
MVNVLIVVEFLVPKLYIRLNVAFCIHMDPAPYEFDHALPYLLPPMPWRSEYGTYSFPLASETRFAAR